jgi:hypothetical protein
MVADDNAVCGKWTIGRVRKVYPGKDKRVRNVTVITSGREYSRPITKIYTHQKILKNESIPSLGGRVFR